MTARAILRGVTYSASKSSSSLAYVALGIALAPMITSSTGLHRRFVWLESIFYLVAALGAIVFVNCYYDLVKKLTGQG